MRPTSHTQNRAAAAIFVGGAHLFVIWLIWDIRYADTAVEEEFGGVLFFLPGTSTSSRAQGPRKQVPRVPRVHEKSQDLADLPSTILSGSLLPATIAAPTVPSMQDWQRALESVATDVIRRAQEDAARSARIGTPPPSASFEPLHERPHDLAWVGQHSRLVINAQGVPQWVLTQPCAVVILLKDPDCTVEHIEQHGFIYEYLQQQHDATLGYGGPNAVP
jgi:hypothetical protein